MKQPVHTPASSLPTFGLIVRRLRERRGWSITQLADMLGCSQQRICNIESSQRLSPTWDTVQRLADAFGVPTDYLRTRHKRR